MSLNNQLMRISLAALLGLSVVMTMVHAEMQEKDIATSHIEAELAGRGVEITPDGLTGALDDKDSYVQELAIYLIGSMQIRQAIPKLRGLLRHSSQNIQIESAKVLAQMGDVSGVEIMRQAIKSGNAPLIGFSAAMGLVAIKDPSGFPVLMRLLATDSYLMRVKAMSGLSAFVPFEGTKVGQDTINVAKVLDDVLLADQDPRIRMEAAIVLQYSGSRYICEHLDAALADKDERVRLQAVAANTRYNCGLEVIN